jgi:signal transduction histidine kinase
MQVSSDLWTVDANLSHLNQVLLRLCVNACNAMPKGGLLVLRAENCFLDGQAAASIEGARAGTYVRLLVEDSGNGSPPAMVARMNEPLIPAALAGDGTGLGLSTIREVIKEIKGFVRLSSAVDNGSLVQIYLPAQEPRLEDPNPAVFQPGKPLVQAPA